MNNFPFLPGSLRPLRTAPVIVAFLAALGVSACGQGAHRKAALVPPSEFLSLTPADEIFELSPARIQIRRLAPQALRLLAPHWSGVREGDRKVLQATLTGTLSEERVAPFARIRLKQAVDANPQFAAAALAWLRSPLGYEVKFADATAWSGAKSPETSFYASVADVRDNQMPAIRMDRILRLAEATDALGNTLDLTAAVGTVVARLVNATRPGDNSLSVAELEREVDRERRQPEVRAAYAPVVTAVLLVRCRDLDLEELDRYIEFSLTPEGRWYHETMSAVLVGAVDSASMDVEGVLEANARDGNAPALATGFDLDSLLVSLPSGGEVRLLALGQTGAQTQPSIVLRYETSLPLQNAAAIRVEAREVFEKVRDQIESEGARAAVLQATGSVDGWVFPFALSRKFAWKRDEAGEWIAARGDGSSSSFGSVEREMLWSVPP